MKKLLFSLILLALAIGNAKAYDFITYAPSGQILYCKILDQSNHLIGLTSGTPKPSGDLVIPETIHSNGADWTITEIMDNAFRESTITSVVIPNTVTAIGNQAFYLCTSLSGTVTIPNSVNTVGYTAFCRCDRMTEVVLPAKDVTYGHGCFKTTGLTGTLTLPEGLVTISYELFYNNDKLTHVVIPHTVTTISQDAFANCDMLEEVLIPNSVTAIYNNPFYSSEKIESVMVEEGSPVYYSENNCIIHQATNTLVIGCKNSVIPEGVVAIGPYAFGQCGLTQMPEIPSSVTAIGSHAFLSCNDHGSLMIPETVTEIASEAFIYGHFTTVTVPQSIDAIPYRMFGMCQWMGEVTIPESITHIGDLAFSWCTKLKKIYVYNPVPPTMNTVTYYHSFDQVPRSATVYVPQGSLSAYQDAPGWNEFDNIVEMSLFPVGTEWYYEIQNENGSITFQHLEYVSDTVIEDHPIHIIVRINTLYDKELSTEKTYEYIYESDHKVYWWNKTLEEFTMLYDFNAQVGDEWEIKVGTEQLLLHVEAEGTTNYGGQTYRTLTVSDAEELFSGTIICGIGHETSFFPEQLMDKQDDYRVEGIRCVWQYGQLIFHLTNADCDEVYFNYHYDVNESPAENYSVFPNPANTTLFVIPNTVIPNTVIPNTVIPNTVIPNTVIPSTPQYHITNLLGQTLLTGQITTENQQINVSSLPEGLYFITIGNSTQKFIVNK